MEIYRLASLREVTTRAGVSWAYRGSSVTGVIMIICPLRRNKAR